MPNSVQPLADCRILVVEDEYLIAMEAKRWLEEAGATVIGPVPSVNQALDIIEDVMPDAALLDINLGDGDTVYPIADKLEASGVPYLFATGETMLSCLNRYRHRLILAKPYLKDELVCTLSTLTTSPKQTS